MPVRRRWLKDLRPEDGAVDTTAVVLSAELRSFTSKPGQFLVLRLRDKSGEVEAKQWEADPALAQRLPAGTPVRIRGSLSSWRGRLDLVLTAVEPLDPATVDPADFLPESPRPIDGLWRELEGFIAQVDDPPLRALLEAFRADDELRGAFCRAPASRAWHHAYVGGLLDHTVGVTSLVVHAAARVPEADRSMLVAGAIFHDLGKVDDYRCDVVIDHAVSGKLLGHIVTGYRRLVDLAARVPGFPPTTLRRLGHVIVAHHGREEWGSPQKPKTLEAQMVHHADNLDAQANGFAMVLREGRDRGLTWSPRHPLLEAEVLIGDV